MPRRRPPERRKLLADPRYGSRLVTSFINTVMRDGKKSVAEGVFYGAMDRLKDQGTDPVTVFKKAVENVKPLLEVKSRRVGGANYQVPVDIPAERRLSLAIRWILDAADVRPGKSMAEKLAGELIDAAQGQGGAFKKKEDTHRMAEANRAFVHFRW